MASLHRRAWNIGVRSAHILVTGILVGGHVFHVAAPRLWPVLWLAIGTGAALVLLESYPRLRWLHEGRGLVVLTKLALLATIPFLWTTRVPILFVVVILASVGSHMPGRFRHYSVIEREVRQ